MIARLAMNAEVNGHNRARGFTLIEMMVAMLIAFVLLDAVYLVLSKSSDGYRRLEGLASIQERGRIAMNVLQGTIEAASYTGCRRNVTINNVLTNSGNYEFDFTNGILGYDGSAAGWSPALPAGTPAPIPSPLATAGDAITVRGPVGSSVKLTAAMATTTSALAVPAGSPFVQGNILMVSDCAGAVDIFAKTDAGGAAVTSVAHAASNGNSTADLGATYGTDATVVKVGTTSFFIRTGTNNLPALWWKENADAAQEILEGVSGMQILYGITTNTDTSANQYLTATQVAAGNLWASVVSVRIALLISTVDSPLRANNAATYSLLGVNYGPYNDRQLRRVFTTNIVLRNRSF